MRHMTWRLFQYLLKPVDEGKLKRVLQKPFENRKPFAGVYHLSRDRQKKKLFLDDIYYFEIKGRMVDVHGPEGILHIMADRDIGEQITGERVFQVS